jgi:hypothetical protein
MIELTDDEARVLGVLIEKAATTPDQYPLSLNAVVNGTNQKNNRDPVMQMEENDAFTALEGLREKGLVIRSDMVGSRVNRYKHLAGEALRARPAEVALPRFAHAPVRDARRCEEHADCAGDARAADGEGIASLAGEPGRAIRAASGS